MITIVFPSLLSSVKSAIISSQVLVSSAPVGSSARISNGFVTMARAIEIRCCCHHESSFGILWSLFPSQTFMRASRARSSRSFFPTH